MSSTASDNRHPYIVYVPRSKNSVPCPIYVPENAFIKTLEEAICKERVFEDDLQGQYPILLKCGNLKMLPRQSLYESALEWLRQRTGDGEDDKLMMPAMRLHDYFPDGPTPEDERMIDVVVVTNSIWGSLNYTALSSSDSLNRFCKEITFLVPRGDGEPDWQVVVNLNNYLGQPSYPQFVENVVQRPRQAADDGNSRASAKMGLRNMLDAITPEGNNSEIFSKLLSDEDGASPYAQSHPEITHIFMLFP
ncbi:uncharacterized protein FOMMEDRAFT_163842 [Fomitiporia mediterranea MF3/22]|uniref:Uncharacterized protein n=1 Tax=Fomitiporia mediterranea (strain MF3/22) TaxID=694068 RepID=R7SF63_FOMME|nr:uncharacterized protein FOMMEDRAFT_163842 [Fomitiporia mediterranea MF3/22]EJC97343.1 hypothetical protein FOMMEDRAFT_163842 [Fomitiporia mediterranea MF3/22]